MTDLLGNTESTITESQATEQPTTQEKPAGEVTPPPADAKVEKVEEPATKVEEGTDTKKEGQETPEKKEADAKVIAPEKYEDFKLPEGVVVDPKFQENVSAVAKELNLPQEQAQLLADKTAAFVQQVANQQADALTAAKAEWETTTRADKEIGGDKLDANLSVAKKALDAFGTPELKKLLVESGLGNHPEIIRTFYRAGKSISEDSFVTRSAGAPPAQKNVANIIYPNQQPKSQ